MQRLFFDIETSRESTNNLLHLANFHSSLELLDEQKRDEVIPELYPQFSRVTEIGYAINDSDPVILQGNEGDILNQFWGIVLPKRGNGSPYELIGFNIQNFDIPFLRIRSSLLMRDPVPYWSTKPWENNVTDIYHLTRWYSGLGHGLKFLAASFGITPLHKDIEGMTGDQLPDDPTTRKRYLENDIHFLRELYRIYHRAGLVK